MWMETPTRSRVCAKPPASALFQCFSKMARWYKSDGKGEDVSSVHELSIAMSILDMAEEEAGRRSAEVDAIHIKLGALSGVAKAALLSAYDLARTETTLQTAELVIEEVPVMIFCRRCQAPRSVPSIQNLSCRECETPSAEILQGRELQVIALELRS
jgi:hydrogenase nickel incorporation protein HypA/HybF